MNLMAYRIYSFFFKFVITFLVMAFTSIGHQSFAQNSEHKIFSANERLGERLLSDYWEKGKSPHSILVYKEQGVPVKRGESIFLELLGNGIGYSLNYDRRFGASRNGLGAKIGVGAVAGTPRTVTIPIGINYLIGDDGRYFELGVGVTIPVPKTDYVLINDNAILGNMIAGYRREPVDGGFSWRINFAPIIYDEGILPFLGLSFGYAF